MGIALTRNGHRILKRNHYQNENKYYFRSISSHGDGRVL